jgi:transcriptional regulator with XRE-family HTH domain
MSKRHIMNADMVRDLIRINLKRAGVSQREYAALCGYDHTHLSRVLNGEKEPGQKILDAEGLQAVVYYEFK